MESRHSTFSAKIRTLTDYYHRTLNQQQPPSGLEIVNILRYFQQTLLGFLKDVQNVPTDTFRLQNSGLARCSLFPNLNYSGLYFALNNLIDAYQLVPSGQIALGHSILNTIKCVYLFLERDVIDQMPYNVACLLSCFPKQLHQEVMQLLCDCVLPFCLNGELSELHYAILSVPAVLMLVFQYTNEPCHHTYLLETLMSLRQDVYKEVLGVIASGTSESRVPSANLLFHYWPLLNPHILDRKPIQYKAHGSLPMYQCAAWTPSRCQHKECSITAGGSQSATASGSKSSPTDYFTAAASPSPVDSSPACYSIKKCFDPIVCCEVAESAPPVLLCKQCADKIVEDYSKVSLYYICQPMPTSNVNVCQNKGCQSGSRLAVSTCFSEDCIRAHQHVPIRLCQECHNTFHVEGNATPEVAAAATSTDPHIFHTRLPCPWTTPDPKTCRDTVEAVVKLLKETSTMLELCDQEGKRPKWLRKLEAGQAVGQEIDEMADEKRMLSRYGIWILAGLCTPSDQAPPECIGYLMSMLFQWFSTTALLPNDPMGSALEQLKTDFVLDWLTSAIGLFYDVFVQCLMPKPPEYGKSGGQWDKLTTRTEQIKEGLNKMLALMPYDVVSLQTWDTIMPEWLEAICNEAPEKDLPELRVNLCKVFEPDLCPLALSVNQMYRFIGIRLEDGDYGDMQKALDWIQLLCEMEIDLPLPVLLHFLTTAVKRMHDMEIYGDGNMKASEPERPPPPVVNPIIVSRVDSIGDHEGLFDDENEGAVSALTPQDSPIRKPPLPGAMMMEAEIGESNGAFYANMLDIITRQIEFSEIPKHEGVSSENTQLILKALTCIVGAPWKGTHTCDQPDTDEFVDCSYCQETLIFHEVMILMELVQRVCPKKEMRIEMLADDDYDWEPPEPEDAPEPTETKDMIHQSVSRTATTTLEMSGGLEAKQSTAIQIDVETGEMVLPLQQVQAAEYEEAEELEFVAALPSEEIETAMARATTLTETDVGLATCQITSATLVEGKGAESAVVEPPLTPSKANFWYTSLGKFRFTLEELPAQLQLIYALMIDVERHPDPDVIYCLLHSMKYLCLHAEALSTAHREHRGFLIWAQENLLIPKLWHMLRSDYSQIAEICVPLIFHCLTLPSGADMFWSVTNEDFMSEDWTIRFAAVEKVSLILMFIDPAPLRNNLLLQGALANAFSFLIVAVQDPNCAIAQRALMIIEDMKPTGLKCLLSCLEAQFDSAVMDRALILHRLHLLTCLLPEQPFLTWEFFLQRFDTLAVEAQLQVAARTGEIAFAQDLLHSDPMSDLYQRKISRARQSLEQIDNVRSMARLMDGAMKYQASVSLKRSVKMEEARLAAKRRQRANDNEKAQMRERAETQSGRDPCKCPKRGWHRCSLENPEAVQARNKVRKVILMVKVMQAWKGMRRRMSAISIGTISTISVMSSLLGTTASAPNTVSNPEVTSTVLKAARAFSSHRYSAPEPVEDSDSDVPPTLVQNYQPKKSFAHFYERELPGQLGPQYGMSETADHALGKLREFTDQESNFCLLLNRAIDSETSERHTMYLTLVLFMQFLSSKKTALVNPDEKAAAKKQSIVMRHLNTLLGYSNTERCFTIPPYKLRSSAICSAFLTGLPAVLDNNRFIGNQILPIALQLLQYMPSPQKFASDNQPITYSLWALDTQSRSSWLWVVLLVLYKYRFDQPPLDDTMVNLVKLILNTLEAQVHVCATVDASAHSPIFQSGDYNLGGYFNESGRSSAARKAASLRHVFNTVLLMVKVMRSWPRGHQRLAEKLSSVSILSSASTISSAGMRSASPVEMDSSSASDVEVSDAELGPTTETQMRSQHKEKKRLGVHRKKRKKRGHKRHETQTIDESEETLLVPTIDSRHRHKPEGLRLRSPKHSPPGSPVQVRRHPVQAPGERVETRIRQQIDEFDRSFVKLDSPVSPQMVTAVPTVVVTPGEPQLVRPEMLQVSAASQHLVTADSHEVHPQVTQVRPMIEQKPTVIEPGTSQSVEVFTISPLASVTTSASQQVHQVLPSLTGNLMSLDAQVLQSPETVRLEAIGEDNDGFLGSGLKGTSGSEDRKTGLKSLLQLTPSQRRKHRLAEIGRQSSAHTVPSAAPGNTTKQTSDATMVLRCTQCDQALENYDEDTIALAVVCLSTFVHREPGMAAPHLPRILEVVAHVAHHVYFPWQAETSVFVPGNCRSVARQFLRVVSHQLAPNGLFLQLFQTQITVPTFFKTLSSSLMDFQELNPVSVLQFLLEGMNSNWPTRMHRLLFNFANYITTIPLDQYLPVWNTVAGLLDLVCIRRYLTEVSQAALSADIDSWVIIINSIFRVQNFSSLKSSVGLLESLTKLVSQALQQAPVKLQDLLTICTACNRAFIRERDRQALSRACVNELLQAVKFKSTLPEQNYVVLLNLVLQDSGETVSADVDEHLYNTCAAECARPFIQDFVDFIADLHVLNKVKNLARGLGFREDTLGGDLKAGLSQYVAVEISKGSVRDPRTVLRYLPWLLSPPSVTQQGPTEFVECVAHVRVLSWILLGALHSTGTATCLPIPIESSQHIADQIQFVLAGFAEQSKESVIHMSALFHAFHLCQLWTAYCEQASSSHPDSDLGYQALANVMDFWARITPAVLQLLSHSKVLADMVNLHFLNTIEALQECQSAILCQLYPMWHPILSAYHLRVPSQLKVRLDAYENSILKDDNQLEPWLKRVRFKISQVELQSSAATQFYSV